MSAAEKRPDRKELAGRRCRPCRGGTPALAADEAAAYLRALPGWEPTAEAKAIRKSWRCRNFRDALAFLNRVGAVAEAEDHHPDLHLVGYRTLRIELTTHAAGGLTENDFILAAKIEEVAPEV